MNDIELAKIGFTVRNQLTRISFLSGPVTLTGEAVGCAISEVTKAAADKSDIDTIIKKLVENGYIKPSPAPGYFATSTKSYKSTGTGADPWVGWIEA